MRGDLEALPTLNVNLFDTKVSIKQKRQLAELLTRVTVEALGVSIGEVMIAFTSASRNDIARAGVLGRR